MADALNQWACTKAAGGGGEGGVFVENICVGV